jgi:hypothetical protein
MRKFSTLYCGIKGGFVKECLLSRGHEREDACDGCHYQTPVYREYKFPLHEPDPRLEVDTSNVRLKFDQPNPKRSHSRLPKKFFVTDPTTGKERRFYRADQEPRDRFTSTLCFLCYETVKQEQRAFCKEKGYELFDKLKNKERLDLIHKGKKRFLEKSISQLMKPSEMKPFKSFKPRTLEEWRRKHCGQLCMKENPDLKIKIGRRGRE